jgi:hypothetical protein
MQTTSPSMNAPTRCLHQAALVLLVTLIASHASARRRPDPDASVQLQLSVERGLQLTAEVESLEAIGARLLSCSSVCSIDLPTGDYRLTLRMPGDSQAMNVRLADAETVSYHGAPRNEGLMYGGMVSLVTGALLFASGVSGLAIEALPHLGPHSGPGESFGTWGVYGAIATPIGLVLALVGFFVFKQQRRPFKEQQPPLAPSSGGISWRLRATF